MFQQPADKKMTFSRFKQHIKSRLQTSAIFRRRLIEIPMDFDLPYWLEDPHFDIEEHLSRHRLSDGSLAELQSQSEIFFSALLDREKPLWEIQFVEGLKEEGEFALIVKIHHCAIDGVAGEEILVGLLDFTEQTQVLPRDTWQPEAFPSYRGLVGRKIRKAKSASKQLWQLVKGSADAANRSINLRVSEAGVAPPLFFDSPSSPFNVGVVAERRLSHVHLPLHEIKEIKDRFRSVTVNDVALAICAGALRAMLDGQKALPADALVAMTPVSTRPRKKEDVEQANNDYPCDGNDVSAMLVSLETSEKNPLARLEKIHCNSRKGLRYNRTIAAEQLLGKLPPMTSAVLTRTFTKLKVSQLLKPIFNVVITNVPGSPIPLYLDGARLLSQSFNAPIYDYAGLTVNVTSYVDVLTIGITTTPDIVPDGNVFNDFIKEAFHELYQAACREPMEAAKTVAKTDSEAVAVC